MQVELSQKSLEKITRYRELVSADMPSFKPSVTTLANEAIGDYFERAIELHQKIKSAGVYKNKK